MLIVGQLSTMFQLFQLYIFSMIIWLWSIHGHKQDYWQNPSFRLQKSSSNFEDLLAFNNFKRRIVTKNEFWRNGSLHSSQKSNWIGWYTLHKGDDGLAKRALDWNPQGSRRAGRPAETWSRSHKCDIIILFKFIFKEFIKT